MRKGKGKVGVAVHHSAAPEVGWEDWINTNGASKASAVDGRGPFATTGDSDQLREAISRLAYSFWEARGCQGGCPEEDWLRAETEIRGTIAARVAPASAVERGMS